MKRLSFIALITIIVACNAPASKPQAAAPYTPPAVGTVIAADSVAITSDPLNHFYFSVTVKASQYADRGVYDVDAAWGPNNAAGQFTMPRGGEHLMPIIRKGDAESYIIGFHYGDDTAFYPYYIVSGNRGTMEMKYLKAYSFN